MISRCKGAEIGAMRTCETGEELKSLLSKDKDVTKVMTFSILLSIQICR